MSGLPTGPLPARPLPASLWTHRGPSLHGPGRCVSVAIDHRGIAGPAMATDADLCRAILDHPAIAPHAEAGGPPAPLVDLSPPGRMAWLAVLLQRTMQHEVADPPPDATPAGARLAVPVWDVDIGIQATRAALDLLALRAASLDAVRGHLDRFFAIARRINPEESTRRLLTLADRRGIPWSRLVPGAAIMRIGDGVRQTRLDGSALSSTGKIAETISIRKSLASRLLRQHGVPAPANRLVATAEEAVRAAAEIGHPVVIKPDRTNYGTAVSTGLSEEGAIRKAFAAAAAHGPVLVERQIDGDHARLLVFRGRFLSAVRQDPAQVVGDGVRTVRVLIDRVNAGRTATLSSLFQRIAIDEEAVDRLAQQALTLDDVPAAGRRVGLRYGSNTSRGGTAWNVTAEVHPDNERLAERATAILGLDIAGVDLITPDVGQSFRTVGGMICEINAGPGLYMREPGFTIEEAILDGLFRGATPGRVPVVCLLGEETSESSARLDRLVDRLAAGGAVGVATPSRLAVGGWPHPRRPRRLHDAAASVLADPETAAAVIQLPPATLAIDGLAFERCDLALVDATDGSPAARLLRQTAEETVDPADRAAVDAAVERAAARHAARG